MKSDEAGILALISSYIRQTDWNSTHSRSQQISQSVYHLNQI